MRPVYCLLLLFIGPPAQAEIYRCIQNGTTVYSDRPCGNDAQIVTPDTRPLGGRFDTNTGIIRPYQPEAPDSWDSPASPGSKGCPVGYIDSTTLNRYRIDRTLKQGMSEAQVRAILGAPDHIDREGWWVYMRGFWVTGRYLFVNGCLQAW